MARTLHTAARGTVSLGAKALRLPPDLAVDDPVRALYIETWHALAAES